MDYTQDTTKHIKGKHFSYGDRRELQGMLSNKSVHYSLRQLARYFNCSPNTIRNELKRGAHHNTGRYGARRAQNAYDKSHANSIKKSKRFLSSKFVSWVVEIVLEKGGPWMPAMVMLRQTSCFQILRWFASKRCTTMLTLCFLCYVTSTFR